MESFMSAATSPLPSPFLPWHIAQSYPYCFFPRASDSSVGFTGFSRLAASTGIVLIGELALGLEAAGLSCAKRREPASSSAESRSGVLHMGASLLRTGDEAQCSPE